MSNNTNHEEETKEFAYYCGEIVELLDINNTPSGTLADIRFEDGREDSVPWSVIKFAKGE